MSHFHIRLSGAEAMEWEPFDTREEADEAARKRVRAGQAYSIEELGEGCTRCQAGNTERPS